MLSVVMQQQPIDPQNDKTRQVQENLSGLFFVLPRVSRPRDALGFWVELDGTPSRSSKRSEGLGGMIFLRVSLPSDALSGIESI